MIAPLGYVIGVNFSRNVFEEVFERFPDGRAGQEYAYLQTTMNTHAAKSFLDNCPSLSIFFVDGRLMRISNVITQTVTWPIANGLFQARFAFLNPITFKIEPRRYLDALFEKSKDPLARDEPSKDEKFLEGFSNSLDFVKDGYLCFAESDYSLKTVLDKKFKTDPDSAEIQASPIDIVRQIVSMADSGEILIRDDVRKLLAPNLKHSSWIAAWRQASEIRPELSKRGPKKPTKS